MTVDGRISPADWRGIAARSGEPLPSSLVYEVTQRHEVVVRDGVRVVAMHRTHNHAEAVAYANLMVRAVGGSVIEEAPEFPEHPSFPWCEQCLGYVPPGSSDGMCSAECRKAAADVRSWSA